MTIWNIRFDADADTWILSLPSISFNVEELKTIVRILDRNNTKTLRDRIAFLEDIVEVK